MCITTIVVQLYREKKPLGLALFLLGVLVVVNAVFAGAKEASGDFSHGVLGGPVLNTDGFSSDSADASALFKSEPGVLGADGSSFASGSSDPLIYSDYGLAVPSQAIPGSQGSGLLATYIIKKGDTFSRIASDFGVSVQTIIGSNPTMKKRVLIVGQELLVPPVSGVVYRVHDGETPESVAAAFGVTVGQLQEFNRGIDFRAFGAGTTIIIPGAHPLSVFAKVNGASGNVLPSLSDYFIMPTEGFNWGILHEHNAVDIANPCGTKVVAAAEGLVTDLSTDAWSSGYGHYVTIEHPNGIKTKYAHLDMVKAMVGDYLSQGDALGTMGNTGDANGCHLHFEVEGARNPFVKN